MESRTGYTRGVAEIAAVHILRASFWKSAFTTSISIVQSVADFSVKRNGTFFVNLNIPFSFPILKFF